MCLVKKGPPSPDGGPIPGPSSQLSKPKSSLTNEATPFLEIGLRIHQAIFKFECPFPKSLKH